MRVGDWDEYPGCTFADAMPEGEFAIFRPGDGGRQQPKFLTHAGDLAPPQSGTDWPIYHFITNVGGFQIVGKSQHFDPITWHWTGIQDGWQPLGPTNGVNGAIFDGAGHVRQIAPGPDATSQGYRFVAPNGEPVLGDETRKPKFGIIEWIDLSDDQDGGLLIGQSTDGRDDCVIRIGGVTRLIQTGRCTFIRARRTGEQVACALFTTRLSDDHPQGGVLKFRATLDQLATLPEVQPREIIVEAVDREMWLGWFEFALPDQRPPGNCFVACDPIGNVRPPGGLVLPTILATNKPVSGPILGQFIPGATVDEIEAQARLSPYRAVAFWDQTREWPRLPNLPPGAWTCVRGYCLKDETPELLERSLRGVINRMPGHQIALVCQCYSGNPALSSDLAGLVPVYARLAKMPQVVALLVFSDWGRDTGLVHHPEVRALWQQVADSIRPPRMPMVAFPSFKISEPTFPIDAVIAPGAEYSFRCVATLDPGAGEPDWIDWEWSNVGMNGPWTLGAHNPGWDKDHTFSIRTPGAYWIRAKAWNAAGTNITGRERRITIRTATTPTPEPPQPPTLEGTTVKTSGGFYWSLGPGGLIEAKATAPDAANVARVVIEPRGDLVALKVNGKYINAVNGGGGELYANRDQAFADELFTLIVLDEGIFTVQAKTLHYVHAEHGGGGRVLATKTAVGPHETFEGHVATGPVATVDGPLRVEGRFFINDQGIFRPRFISAFGTLGQIIRGADAIPYLDWVRAAGFNGVRYLAGNLPWLDDQTAEAALQALPVALQLARQRGLYVEVAALTETKVWPFDKAAHVGACGQACGESGIGLLEAANEPNHPTQDDATQREDELLRWVQGAPVPSALGADITNDESDRYAGGRYVTVHLDRGRDKWNMVRRVRELEAQSARVGKPVWNNEPIGADDNVDPGRRENDPAIFFTFGVLNRIFEVGGVHHAQHGLRSELPTPNQRLCAEAFIQGATLWSNPAALAFKNAGWADSPVKSANFDQVVRAYSGISGNEGLLALVGLRGNPEVEFQHGWRVTDVLAEHPGVRVHRLAR